MRSTSNPSWRAVLMTLIACIRHADCSTQVGPRDPETVVVARINDHVSAGRHVAGHAPAAGRVDGMQVVTRRLAFRRLMALTAIGATVQLSRAPERVESLRCALDLEFDALRVRDVDLV